MIRVLKENVFHRFHIGQEQQPIVALVKLCEALPENEEWMKRYSALVLHSHYYQGSFGGRRALRRTARRGLSRE